MTSTEAGQGGDVHAVAAFVAKWREREPEMAFAEVFCPRASRARFALWGALVHAWRETAFELSDARPAEAKCAWWADEALRSAQAMPRHPLTKALAAPQLPWGLLAQGLLAVAHQEPARPVDRDAALASVAPLGDAIAAIEGALFESVAGDAARRAVSVHLLTERLRIGVAAPDGARIPLSLLARHGVAASALQAAEGQSVRRDWAVELAAAMPPRPLQAAPFRRARAAFDAWHLGSIGQGRPRRMPAPRALLLAWRSARDLPGRG